MNADTKTTTTNTARAKLSLIEEIERTSSAWRTHAPEAKFANKNWAEFRSATEMSRFYRTKVDTLNVEIRGVIASRNQADKAAESILGRVIAGVKGHAAFGPDSPLYGAMGFVPTHERKRPVSPAPEEPAAPKKPSAPKLPLAERLAKVRSAWVETAPGEEFSAISLAQFDEAVAPSSTTRGTLATSRTNLNVAMGLRYAADAVSRALVRRVVLSIKAEEAYGADSALYRALGYIPASERRMPRRSATAATTAPEAPAQ